MLHATMLQRASATVSRRVLNSVASNATGLKLRTGFQGVDAFVPVFSTPVARSITTLEEVDRAASAWKKSCYFEMDFTIPEEATVFEAVQRFAAFNIGALVTLDSTGHISGVVSERDYINKIALLGRTSKDTKIKEISTKSSNLLTARPSDSIDSCMEKMLSKDIRHLPLLNDDGKVIGILSIKDIIKELVKEKDKQLEVLSNFAMGKGGVFGAE